MQGEKYIKMLVEQFHSATVATIGPDGHPQTRVIDMMLWDEEGVYFLTAQGKEFFRQLIEQEYVAVSAVKGKAAVSLRGWVRCIGSRKLREIFEKNPYMKEIYPGDTADALQVFCIYKAQGEYFDISDPSHVVRDGIAIGAAAAPSAGYFIEKGCTGCGVCAQACPQRCVDTSQMPAVIDQGRCLRCGRCLPLCPQKAIVRRD